MAGPAPCAGMTVWHQALQCGPCLEVAVDACGDRVPKISSMRAGWPWLQGCASTAVECVSMPACRRCSGKGLLFSPHPYLPRCPPGQHASPAGPGGEGNFHPGRVQGPSAPDCNSNRACLRPGRCPAKFDGCQCSSTDPRWWRHGEAREAGMPRRFPPCYSPAPEMLNASNWGNPGCADTHASRSRVQISFDGGSASGSSSDAVVTSKNPGRFARV